MDRRLDIGGLTGVFALGVGAAAFVGRWLTQTINPERLPALELVALLTTTLLLSTVAAALALALVARIIAVTGGFTTGFWPQSAIVLQDYALFLSVWTVIWGGPFAVAMFSGAYLERFVVVGAAMTLGIVVGIVALLALRRFLSREVWRVIGEFNPASRLGNVRMLLLLFLLLWAARQHVNRCYIFDVSVASTAVSRKDPLEVHAKLSGRITDHQRLRLRLTRMGASTSVVTQRFATEEPGSYVALVDTSKFAQGAYRLHIFFAEPPQDAWSTSWSPSYGDIRRTILIRIR